MERNQVNITISGMCGSGKSNIMYLIKKFLKENNFEVDFKLSQTNDFSNEFDFDEQMSVNNENTIKAISQRTRIILEEKQLRAPFK